MRVLALSSLYPPAELGGYERMCRDVIERFRASGHRVAVLTTTFGGLTTDDDPDVHRALELYWNGSTVECPSWRGLVRREWRNERAFARLLASLRPDVISVWGMGAMSLGLLATAEQWGLPVVLVVGDDWLVYGRWADCWTRRLGDGPALARRVARRIGIPPAPDVLGRTGTFCFVSEYTRRRATEHPGNEITRGHVVPAGIDPVDFPLTGAETPRPWRGQILCVGRVYPDKRFDLVVRALAELPPEWTLTIIGPVGPPDHLEELRRLARDAGAEERVRWTQCRRSELAAHYRAADALVFPSGGHEAFGLVPLEAMACATPVIASGAGGSAEYLAHEGNCLRFDAEDPSSLTDALRRLAGEPALRRRLVEGGLTTAARLTVDEQARRLEALHLAATAGEAEARLRP